MAWAVLTIDDVPYEYQENLTVEPGERLALSLLGPHPWKLLDLLGRTAVLTVATRTILKGKIVRAEHGADDEVCKVDITPIAAQPSDLVPSIDVVVTKDRWTAPTDTALGSYYPQVYGYPGEMPGDELPHPIVPVVLVELPATPTTSTTIGLVCGAGVQALTDDDEVRILVDEGEDWAALLSLTDDEGTPVVCIRFDSDGASADGVDALLPSSDVAMYAGFDSSHSVTQPWSRLLSKVSGLDLSWSAPALELLSSYRVDVAINEPVDPWQYLESILETMPVVISTTDQGLKYIRIDSRVIAQPAHTHLHVSRGDCWRLSSVALDASKIINHVSAEYRQSRDNAWLSRVETSSTNGIAVSSIAQFGLVKRAIQIPWTWDDSTAASIAQIALRRAAQPTETCQYRVPGGAYRVGDTLKITDEEVRILAQPCWVATVDEDEDGQTIGVELLSGGARDAEAVVVVSGSEPALANLTAPTITGSAQEGSTLTRTIGTYNKSATLNYEWKRGATVVSTASAYTLVEADIGETIVVEETATDGLTTVVTASSATLSVAGKVKGFTFAHDGCIKSAAALAISGAHTLTAWVYLDDLSTGNTLFSTSNNDAGDHWMNIYASGVNTRYRRRVGASGNIDTDLAADPSGSWVHMAVTYDGAVEKTYHDGVLVFTSTISGTHTTSDSFIWAARDTAASVGPLSGLMADLRVYSGEKTAGQVAAIAAEDGLSPDVTNLVSRLADAGSTLALTERVASGPSWSSGGTAPTLSTGPTGLYVRG